MISSLYPPHKMVTATIIDCTGCSYSYSIEYEKPELAPKTVSKECPICKEEHVSISHRYVNAVNVEVQDTESFSEIERLSVILFNEYTRDIHAGERVTIEGKIHIIKTGKRGKLVSFLYADSVEYEFKENVIISKQDRDAIERFTRKHSFGIIDKLVSMFANTVIGYEHVKEGLLLCAASSGRDVKSCKQTRLNALLVGDPGLAKSELLREAVKLVPNSRYESGQNSSGRSLTAIVSKEDESYVLRINVPLLQA
jgi:DNA replicative helicase MCM subunit Mcm2 (Cdc46/Mcm family)